MTLLIFFCHFDVKSADDINNHHYLFDIELSDIIRSKKSYHKFT